MLFSFAYRFEYSSCLQNLCVHLQSTDDIYVRNVFSISRKDKHFQTNLYTVASWGTFWLGWYKWTKYEFGKTQKPNLRKHNQLLRSYPYADFLKYGIKLSDITVVCKARRCGVSCWSIVVGIVGRISVTETSLAEHTARNRFRISPAHTNTHKISVPLAFKSLHMTIHDDIQFTNH